MAAVSPAGPEPKITTFFFISVAGIKIYQVSVNAKIQKIVFGYSIFNDAYSIT